MDKKKSSSEKKLRLWLYITLLIYTLIGYGLVILAGYVFDKNPVPFLTWLNLRTDVVYLLYLVIGFCCIFFHYWKKPWGYLQEVIDATKTVYLQNDDAIELSEPLKDMEKQMNQIKMSILLSQQAVKEAESKKNELVMYIAHDIRTPLTSIIGYLSLLDEAPDMPTRQKVKFVGTALNNAKRLEKLINEFFEITRYNTQQIKLTKKNVDLYFMLVQMLDEFYPLFSAKGNTSILNVDEDLTVYADSEKLARAFHNILKNAVTYSYSDTEIIISARTNTDKIVITFENHGPTIPPEELSTIFEKFNRLDNARKSDTGGAGLGLSIAEDIIHLHGGGISVQSKNDTVTFTVSLPIPS